MDNIRISNTCILKNKKLNIFNMKLNNFLSFYNLGYVFIFLLGRQICLKVDIKYDVISNNRN